MNVTITLIFEVLTAFKTVILLLTSFALQTDIDPRCLGSVNKILSDPHQDSHEIQKG